MSDVELWNPQVEIAVFCLSNQALGACLRPYKALRCLQTCCDWETKQKPSGGYMNTFSVKSPLRKALFTSSCWTSQLEWTTKENIILIVAAFTKGEN